MFEEAQVFVGVHGWHAPDWHVVPGAHVPLQKMVVPQASWIVPHSIPKQRGSGHRQFSSPPQPSEIGVHTPSGHSVIFAHVLHVRVIASHACPEPHPPQSFVVPHEFAMMPHFPVQSTGESSHGEHLCVAPTQIWPPGHVPQL